MIHYNATCTIHKPALATSTTVTADKVITETEQTPVRCLMMPVTIPAVETLLGEVTPTGFHCRLLSPLQIGEKWRLDVTLDEDGVEHTYMVRSAVKNALRRWHLIVERV